MKYKLIVLFIYIFFANNLFAQTRESNTVDLDSIARKFKLDITYNEVTGDILLSDKKNQVRLIPGLNYFECNQKIHELPRPTYMADGQVFVSYKLIDYLSHLQVVPAKKPVRFDRAFPADFTIVIDAGHGGKDPGTEGIKGIEKKVALNVSLLLQEELSQMGANVLMTRSKDVFIPLPERPLLASTSSADIFISLHLNASKDKTAEGVEVFVYRYQDQEFENNRASAINQNISFKKSLLSDDCYISMGIETDIMRLQLFGNVERSHKLASSILEKILEIGNTTNRGVKEANFVVLRNATCPAILVELGFLSHVPTENKFLTDAYCKLIAEKIAEGVEKYWKEK